MSNIKTINQITTKQACTALIAILQARYLLLEGIRLLRKLPGELKTIKDPGYALAKELEPHFYIGAAGIVMIATFGKEGRLRELANKAVIDIVKEDMAKEDAKHQDD